MDPALLALLATANTKIAHTMMKHVVGELTAEQAATETAEIVKGLMDGLNVLDGGETGDPDNRSGVNAS